MKKKLLFATESFPLPLDRGHHIRIWNLLGACARAFDVTFLGPPPARDEDAAKLEQSCEQVVFVGDTDSAWRDRFAQLAQTARLAPGFRFVTMVRRYEPYVAALRRLNPAHFDLVWAERPQMASIFRDTRARVILDFDDIEHLKLASRLKVEPSARQKLHDAYRYAFYRRLEFKWARECLASVVCSDEDGAYLRRHGAREVFVVPNAPSCMSPPSDAPTSSRNPRSPLKLAFLGHLASQPNADAIAVLVTEVLPRLRKEFPDVMLDVIGGGDVPRAAPQGVHYRGYVDDLGQALTEYDMLAAPLRFGSGTKLKVLDAMANGLPVVTSFVGAQGLPLVHGEDAMIANDPSEMVAAITRVKREPELAARLAMRSRAIVDEHFSWEPIQRQLADRLSSLASGEAAPGVVLQ